MDQAILVESQIKDGQELIDLLAEHGVVVTAACWVLESEGPMWLLYLVTPLVGENGDTLPAYRRIFGIIRALPEPLGIDPSRITAVGPSEPVGKAILDAQRRLLSKRGGWYNGGSLDYVEIEGAYIYPPPVHKEAV
jgi:hypothetical protein